MSERPLTSFTQPIPRPPTVGARDSLSTKIGEELGKLGARRNRAEPTSLLAWSLDVPEPKVGRLDFDAFPFQIEMYEVLGGPYRDVVVRKGTQVGASSMLVRWAIHQSDMNGRTIMYVFPTAGDVYDWGDTRISPLFEQEYLSQRKGEPFNKGLKAIGSGFVFFRGSESKRKLDSVDADGIALDEYDTLNQRNIPDAERRLSGPLSAGLIRRIGVPSLPDFGISERYDESDRRKWLVRCENPACKNFRGRDREQGDVPLRTPDKRGGWQEIDFWRNVVWDEVANGKVIVNARRVCENCREPIDVAEGKWCAQQPESPIPGFHISRLIAPGARLEEIARASKRTTPYEVEVFYNKDLGLPYVSKTARLSAEEINAAKRNFGMVSGYAGAGTVTMGVDVASERALNVRISLHLDDERKKALWIGEIEDDDVEGLAFNRLAKLMVRYNVSMCGIDALPESRLARQLAARFPGRVYLVRLTGHATKQVITVDDELCETTVKRTEALDATVEMIRAQKNLLPEVLPETYVPHLTANIRKVETNVDTGDVKVLWVPTRPDDYAMAELFDMVATELFNRRMMLGQAVQPVEVLLDEVHPFRRSTLDRYDDGVEYHVGPGTLSETDALFDPMYVDEAYE